MASTRKQDVQQLLAAAVAACEEKKAVDLCILSLDPAESGLTDYFLICTGNNDRQSAAITDEIEIRLKRDFGTSPTSVEGRRQGEWILMDYVDFIVHVFSPEKRAFYGLERLRKSAKAIRPADLARELRIGIAPRRKSVRRNSEPQEQEPDVFAEGSRNRRSAKATKQQDLVKKRGSKGTAGGSMAPPAKPKKRAAVKDKVPATKPSKTRL